jgi:hypothetical protein
MTNGDNLAREFRDFRPRPSRSEAPVIYLRAFKATTCNRNEMSGNSTLDEEDDMARTLIAISLITMFGLFTAFAITMAASYAINERCTEQMAWDGNC